MLRSSSPWERLNPDRLPHWRASWPGRPGAQPSSEALKPLVQPPSRRVQRVQMWLHSLDRWLALAFHSVAVGRQRCATTDSSRGGRCSYPSMDVRATEAEGRIRDEWGACHNIVSSYKLGEEGGQVLVGGFDSALWENTLPACCEMAPQRRPFEPELIDSLCHDADELLGWAPWAVVWRYVKRTKLRGRGQSQSPNTPPRPKPPEEKAVIYFAITRTERDHVSHGGGTLIMLSEEDGRMLFLSAVTVRHAGIEPTWARLSPAAKILCPLFFLIDPWEKENEMARVAESLSEKKADRERREARLKRSQFEQSAPLSAASAWDFPKRDTYSTWVSSACRGRWSEICSSSKAFLDLTV